MRPWQYRMLHFWLLLYVGNQGVVLLLCLWMLPGILGSLARNSGVCCGLAILQASGRGTCWRGVLAIAICVCPVVGVSASVLRCTRQWRKLNRKVLWSAICQHIQSCFVGLDCLGQVDLPTFLGSGNVPTHHIGQPVRCIGGTYSID